MGKLALLEKYQYWLKEEEFNNTWTSFSRPLEIFEYQSICVSRLKMLDDRFYEELREMT